MIKNTFVKIFVGLMLCSFSSMGQVNFLDFESIDLSTGLSNNNILCIEQDHFGFLWIGTADGLNCYNGYDCKIYRHSRNDSTSISNNIIRCLYLDSRDNLWIGTDEGLNRYNYARECFEVIRSEPYNVYGLSDDMIRAIYEDKNHILWIGTYNKGINKFYPEEKKFITFLHDPKDTTSISSNNITALESNKDGFIWVGTINKGLNLLNIEKNTFQHFNENPDIKSSIVSNGIVTLYKTPDNTMWVGTTKGLSMINEGNQGVTFTNFINPEKNSRNWVYALRMDETNTLWVGYQNEGVYNVDISSGNFTKIYNDIKGPIYTIFKDNSGIMWFGTAGMGLKKFNPIKKQFSHYHHRPETDLSINDNFINTLFETTEGDLLIGTNNGGINLIERKNNTEIIHYIKNDNNDPRTALYNYITCLYQDDRGKIWIGTRNGLLAASKQELLQSGKLKYSYLVSDKPEMMTGTIWNIMQDKEGVFWISTMGSLVRFDYYNRGNTLEKYFVYKPDYKNINALCNGNVWKTMEDTENNIWVCTSQGLARYDRKKGIFKCYLHQSDYPGSISSNSIKTIYQDTKGNIWIGTIGGGLNKYVREKDEFISWQTEDGLSNNTVFGIVEDTSGNLWLTTNFGLNKFNTVTESFTIYTEKDGIQSNEFRIGAYHKGKSGKIYVGGINGFNAFYPEKLVSDTIEPTTLITELRIQNTIAAPGILFNKKKVLSSSILVTKHIELSNKNNNFTLEFASLHFSNPQKNQYLYKLEGYDTKFYSTGSNRRTVTYTNLPSGKYTFLVKSSNCDNLWNHTPASLSIRIYPPFYKSFWFYSILTLIGGILVYLFFKKREEKHLQEKSSLIYEKDLLQTLMDNIPDSIYFKDKHSRFIRINRTKANDIGLREPEDAIGKSDFDFFAKEDAKEAFIDEQKIIKNGTPLINKIEKRVNGKTGEAIWFSATKVPYFDKLGRIAGTVGITRNITEQIRSREELQQAKSKAEEADKLKSAFLANMSHEIRTPMNAIIGFSDLLNDPDTTEEDKISYIEYIRNNGKSLLTLIDDIIDTAKIEANQIKINKINFNINILLKELYVHYNQEKQRIYKEEINIVFKPGIEDEKFILFFDSYRIKQILSNLISNTLKFTTKGTIEFGYELMDKTSLRFFVKDTGIGIESDRLHLIFDRFAHFENRFNVNIAGTGLGLSISKRLVELLGGNIWVTSTPGIGSTFYFTIVDVIK